MKLLPDSSLSFQNQEQYSGNLSLNVQHEIMKSLLDQKIAKEISQFNSNWKVIRNLKNTIYGAAFLGKDREKAKQNELMVFKASRITTNSDKPLTSAENCISESSILSSLPKHPNIVDFIDTFRVKVSLDDQHLIYCGNTGRKVQIDHQIICMEYLGGGDLFDYVSSKGRLSEQEARVILRHVLKGLEHIHQLKIAHLDISLENVLLKDDMKTAKLADFGQARIVDQEGRFHLDMRSGIRPGKLRYMAPEIVNSSSGQDINGYAADIYSLGVTLFCMLVGFHPYMNPNRSDIGYLLVENEAFDELLEYYDLECCFCPLAQACQTSYCTNPERHLFSDHALDLISRMMCRASERLTIPEIWCHPWLKDGAIS